MIVTLDGIFVIYLCGFLGLIFFFWLKSDLLRRKRVRWLGKQKTSCPYCAHSNYPLTIQSQVRCRFCGGVYLIEKPGIR